jgi:hypothetical protein
MSGVDLDGETATMSLLFNTINTPTASLLTRDLDWLLTSLAAFPLRPLNLP